MCDVSMVSLKIDTLSISKMLVLHKEFTSYDTIVLNAKYWEYEMNILGRKEAFFSVTVLKERGIQRRFPHTVNTYQTISILLVPKYAYK
jgi:hypothetical protein